MARRVAIIAGIILSLGILLALTCLTVPMWPMPRGDSRYFWLAACGIDLGGGTGSVYHAALIQDGRAYYSVVGYHGPIAYWLPESEAMKDYPRVITELERLTGLPDDDWRKTGYSRWKSLGAAQQNGLYGLFAAMNDAWIEQAIKRRAAESPGIVSFWQEMNEDLRLRADKVRVYWANLVFESLFFIGLIWFVLWPAIRRARLWRWLLHAAIAPFLLLSPLWLGYCIMSRSPWGLTGGILYPWMIWIFQVFRGSENWHWEIAFFRTTPKMLAPISQGIWDPMFMEGRVTVTVYTPGPFHALIAAMVLCGLIIAWRIGFGMWRKWRARHQPRGFEVVLSKPS